jgi:hypothetical protein
LNVSLCVCLTPRFSFHNQFEISEQLAIHIALTLSETISSLLIGLDGATKYLCMHTDRRNNGAVACLYAALSLQSLDLRALSCQVKPAVS